MSSRKWKEVGRWDCLKPIVVLPKAKLYPKPALENRFVISPKRWPTQDPTRYGFWRALKKVCLLWHTFQPESQSSMMLGATAAQPVSFPLSRIWSYLSSAVLEARQNLKARLHDFIPITHSFQTDLLGTEYISVSFIFRSVYYPDVYVFGLTYQAIV